MIHPESYPPEQRIGAIPEALFIAGQNQEVHECIAVDATHELNAFIGPTRVFFVDSQNASLGFDMKYQAIQGVGFADVTVYTRWNEGDERQLYPGLYASRLVARSIQHFDAMHGRLEVFMHQWNEGSDNRMQYEAALADIENPTDEDQRRAAFATWSGIVSVQNGFDQIIGRPYEQPAIDGTRAIFAEFTRRKPGIVTEAGLPKRIRRTQ